MCRRIPSGACLQPVSAEELERAKRLLAHEAATSLASDTPTAVRAYDKLLAQVTPLIGVAGAELLFVRSAKMQGDTMLLADISLLHGAARLRASLQAMDPAAAPDATAPLFATFLALVANFIGKRLTAQVVRRAWPTFDKNLEEIP